MSKLNIRTWQLNPVVGDLKGNTELILSAYKKAEQSGIDLLILPELVLCGYPPMDLLERASFMSAVENKIKEIAASTGKTALLFGAPTPNKSSKGRKWFNSAVFCFDGTVQHLIHKTLLPTYDVFDEFRYFEPAKSIQPIVFRDVKLGITVCEDLWNNENEIVYHTYDVNPAMVLAEQGAEVIINISASPFTKQKPELRSQMLRNHAKATGLPVIYANQTGANTEIIFDGDSMAVQPDGSIEARAALFEEDGFDLIFEKSGGNLKATEKKVQPESVRDERIFRALVLGIRDYIQKSKLGKKVVLGLSGGIDSALVAAIAAEACGPENVYGITMPSEFSSEGSVSDSEKLARNLGINFSEIAIKSLYEEYITALNPFFEGTDFGIAEENLQSRTRGVLLMALSNKFGYMLLNTGNKSEMAVGYCTLYGDMAGGLSVLSDVYKMEVFSVCRWLNENWYKKEVIPESIITKPPSAELRPDQKDTDSLPEYAELDKILKAYIEDQLGPDEIREKYPDLESVDRIVRLVDLNEYKRRQAAPGLKVSAKAFGIGRRMPIVQRWTSQQSVLNFSEKK